MVAESKWLDFHTHFGEDGSVNSPFAVVSISVEDVDEERMPNLFTIGLHPWQTDRLDSYRMVVNRLPGLLAQRRCLALGVKDCSLHAELRIARFPGELPSIARLAR